MPLPDNALDRLRAAFVSTDSAQADGAPALRLQATGAQSFTSITLSAPNAITFTAASAEIIPGATSLLFRNNADNATNLSITDAGIVTVRSGGYMAVGDTTGANAANAFNVSRINSDNTIFLSMVRASTVTHNLRGGPSGATTDLVWINDASGGYSWRRTDNALNNMRLTDGGVLTVASTVAAGIAGTSLGIVQFNGNTSGTISMQGAAAAGTWTFTLPPDDGDAGEQLQTNGSGVTTWESAASMQKFKNVYKRLDPREGLRRILAAPVSEFTYKTQAEWEASGGVGRVKGTGDHATRYAGVMAADAPWAMHHNGMAFSPVSAFGHAAAAIQALQEQIDLLKRHPALA